MHKVVYLFSTFHWIRQNISICLNFRTLVGVLDDYFDGYYSEEMLESQVLSITDCKLLLNISKSFNRAICFIFSRAWSSGII